MALGTQCFFFIFLLLTEIKKEAFQHFSYCNSTGDLDSFVLSSDSEVLSGIEKEFTKQRARLEQIVIILFIK